MYTSFKLIFFDENDNLSLHVFFSRENRLFNRRTYGFLQQSECIDSTVLPLFPYKCENSNGDGDSFLDGVWRAFQGRESKTEKNSFFY